MAKYYKNHIEGFTLIELLVVISIIALLLSILMPSLSKAKSVARRVVCQANEKQLHLGWTTYSLDNNNELATPVRQGTNPWWEGQWPYRFTGYLHDLTAESHDIGRPEWKGTAMYCPAAKNIKPPEIYYEAITYGLNAFLGGTWDKNGNLITRSGSYDKNAVTKLKMTQIRRPVGTMVWADAGYNGRSSFDLSAPQFYLEHASTRHSGKVNLVYADGHVEWSLPKSNAEMEKILIGK